MGKSKLLIKSSATKEIEALGQKGIRQRIIRRISSLAENPRPHGCEKLSGKDNRFRIREGQYRILYSIDDAGPTLVVVKVAHRKEVYR